MTRKLRDKWCAALRSGEYEQGTDWLRTQEDKYCCLGVLMDITGTEWTKATGKLCDNHTRDTLKEVPIYRAGPHGCEAMLAQDDMEDVGLSADTCVKLASLNDEGKTFLEIADIIESNSLSDPINLEGDDSEQPGTE